MDDLAVGAVRSLLGLIREEARLLGGVRGDVQYIKDEMESMNSFLLHLVKKTPPAGEHDKPVRTWMKQVRDLAHDCSNCIDIYVQRRNPDAYRARGIRSCVWRLPWSVRAWAAQRRAATQLRELKIRAHDVGERRLRYGVEVPRGQITSDGESALGASMEGAADDEDDEQVHLVKDADLRKALDFSEPEILLQCTEVLRSWLVAERPEDEAATTSGRRQVTTSHDSLHPRSPQPGHCPRVMAIAAPDTEDGRDVAQKMWDDLHSLPQTVQFERKAWLTLPKYSCIHRVWEILRHLLERLLSPDEPASADEAATWDKMEEDQLIAKIREHLQGKRSLIILEAFNDAQLWEATKSALCAFDSAVGSAVIVITKFKSLAEEVTRFRQGPVIYYSLVHFFHKRANEVVQRTYNNASDYQQDERGRSLREILHGIFKNCEPHGFCMKLFFHTLYADPDRTKQELEGLCSILDPDDALETSANKMLTFCYNSLPKDFKSCLLYLAVFPREQEVKRSRLIGRWLADGLITRKSWASSVRHAERCFNALVNRWFISPGPAGISTTGKIRTCMIKYDLVHRFVSKMARKEHFLDTRLSLHLAWHFSIESGLWLRRSDTITGFLGVLPPSSQLYLLKVLDLQGCQGLEKNMHRCLKNICNRMLLLKYLNLRGTGITRLPMKINKLQQLEVLDIRQTKVHTTATKYIVLPKLRHLLAGGDSDRSTFRTVAEGSFTAFETPHKIEKMVHMEVLSCVEFSFRRDASRLGQIGRLWRLRKLSVVIYNKKQHVQNFLGAISDLSECLQSLSVRIKSLPGSRENTSPNTEAIPDTTSASSVSIPDHINNIYKNPPKLLESLNINGNADNSRLLLQLLVKEQLSVEEPHQLVKVTLSNTLLNQDSVKLYLAKVSNLRSLRLRCKAYAERMLTFNKDDFKSLEYLLVEGSEITAINFDVGAAPKLEKIVWSFNNIESLSGLNNLPMLGELEFDGDSIPDQVRQAIEAHPNHPAGLKATLSSASLR